MVELLPGRFLLDKGRFMVTVLEKGKMKFGISNAIEGETGLFQQALRTHLETAGCSNVWADILSWREGVADNLRNCHDLLKRVRTNIEKSFRISIPIEDNDTPGFLMDFPILICASAVEQARGSAHFKGFRYSFEDSRLKYGGFQIYIGIPNEDLEPIKDAHISLREACANWKQAKDIAKQRQHLNDKAMAITQQLQEFIAFKYLPGHCKFCAQ